jgi:Tol biopolymer transport system component
LRPAWSPNGRHIPFICNDNWKTDIYLPTLATGEIRQPTRPVQANEFHPKWRADGTVLIFSRNEMFQTGKHLNCIVELNLSSEEEKRLFTEKKPVYR